MPPDDETQIAEEVEGAPAGDPPAPPAAHVQAVLDSPEYKELAKQNRTLAREAGRAKAAEEAARAEAARQRQAAEAQQQAALEQQIADILGDEGVTEWNAIAELAGTNQVEAAKRLKALMTSAAAQSPAVPPAAPAAPAATPPEAPVPNTPPRGVDGDAPLTTPPGNEISQLIGTLEANYQKAVETNQNRGTRNRMTMRDRAAALIQYVGAEYLKQGARPKS